MNLTAAEQLELIKKIETEVGGLGDYLYEERDPHMNACVKRIETALAVLRRSFYDENTYVKLIDRESGEVVMKHFEKGDVGSLCHYAARCYAFSDYDDTYRIDEIMCDGQKLEYVGWQPGMLFEFRNIESNQIVYSAAFEHWDH